MYSYAAKRRSPPLSHFAKPRLRFPQSSAFARGDDFAHSLMCSPNSAAEIDESPARRVPRLRLHPHRDRRPLRRCRYRLLHREAHERLREREGPRVAPRHFEWATGMARAEPARRCRGMSTSVKVHQVSVRRVRLVELEHRELGVVPSADALVAVAAPDLVYALHPADDEPLQVELRRDAHVEVHVEGVVVRAKRPGGRAADHGVHRGRFDFEKADLVEDRAHRPDDVAPRAKHVRHLGVGDEVDVSLPVPKLHVLQPVPLLGQRPVGLRENAKLDGGMTESSPRLEAVSAPWTSTMSPDVDVAQADRMQLAIAACSSMSCISPVRSRIRRNDSPPVERSAMTRPQTWTCRPAARRSTSAAAYLPPSTAPSTLRRTSCTASGGPLRPTSLANGFSPRPRMRDALARRASMMASSADRPSRSASGTCVDLGSPAMGTSRSVDVVGDSALLQRPACRGEQIRLDELIQVAVEDGVDVPVLMAGPQILHETVRL